MDFEEYLQNLEFVENENSNEEFEAFLGKKQS